MLLESGANVLFADLALRPEAKELVWQYAQGTPRAVFQHTDVSSWTALESMFRAAQEHFGSVDIVCPGAGIYEPKSSNFWFPPGTPESKDDMHGNSYKLFDINVTHPVRTTQLAISHFLAASPPCSPSNPKTIIHVASIAGEAASLTHVLYHTSKHAIYGFVRSLAELEELCGIRVAAIAPAHVKTPLWLEDQHNFRIVENASDSSWVSAQDVATAMLAMVNQNEINPRSNNERTQPIPIQGGTILEIGQDFVRDIPIFNNSGPPRFLLEAVNSDPDKRNYQEVVDMLKPEFGKTAISTM